MPLEEYRRKRSFERTPEPAGAITPEPAAPRAFVVQMHSARRLHYDLRLEIEGVLKCWAVPKGPSLNPADKRLAVMTEDHPMQYATFEGVIPAGNYGAGPMMVWDTGTFEPEGPLPAAQQLERGDLKFVLHGQKLRGSFVLVKIKRPSPGSKGNEWLLIKHADGYTDPHWDIDLHQRSALTGRTIEEINEGVPPPPASPAELPGARRAAMPERLEPMLGTLIEKPFSSPAWIFELKLDGMRTLARLRRGAVELWSRTGRNATAMYPELAGLADLVNAREAVLDGEIVVLDEQGRPSFGRLQSRMHTEHPSAKLLEEEPILYYVFDILYCDGYDLRPVPLLERKQFLRRVLRAQPPVRFSEHVPEQGRELYELAKERGLEGIIGKRAASPYASGRSSDWVKLKITSEIDAVIGGWTAPRGGQRFGALLLGLSEGPRLRYIGNVGTGFDARSQEAVWSRLQEIQTPKCPFIEAPKTKEKATWVKPALVARVKFAEWTSDQRLRAPVFLGLRPDLDPRDCRLEKPSPVAVTSSPVLGAWDALEQELETGRSTNVVVNVDGREFRLTNLNKVYFPQPGYTKRHLLAYYLRVADLILPFLRNRPLVLRRTPDGASGEAFFQKDARDDAPSWMPTFPHKGIRYFLCNDLPSLLFLTNLGCIEHNVWSSQTDDLDHPDYLFFDLDPADQAEYSTVVAVASAIYKLLQKVQLQAFLKTSGATGFHMYVPVERVYTSDHVRTFTEIVARLVAAKLPEMVTLERAVSKRDAAKVYIDYSQNATGRPLTVVYSARPFPEATVSAPVSARELKPDLTMRQFTIATMAKRLKTKGDLWAGFWKSRQRLEPALERLQEFIQTTD